MIPAPRAPIRQVLVATDFSPTAEAALAWAREVALAHRAGLRLVHALLLPNAMTDFIPSPPDVSEALEAAAVRRLEQLADAVRQTGLAVDTDLRLGLPSESILEAAAQSQPDLLVLGTRGTTGLAHLLLGSTAERVVQRAACPVLTVHPADGDPPRRVKTILVPTDFSRDAEPAAAVALDLLEGQRLGARLVLLHAYHLPYEYTVYGTIPTAVRYQEDVGALAEERLERLAEALRGGGLEVEAQAREGYPPEIIVEAAAACGADLIAMGTNGRSGLAHLLLGSTAERVVQRARCPVLTVRRL